MQKLTITEFVATIALVIIVVAACFNYLGTELATLITDAFQAIPPTFNPR